VNSSSPLSHPSKHSHAECEISSYPRNPSRKPKNNAYTTCHMLREPSTLFD
jgi:hypothetical protein